MTKLTLWYGLRLFFCRMSQKYVLQPLKWKKLKVTVSSQIYNSMENTPKINTNINYDHL